VTPAERPQQLRIRPATDADLAEVAEIYADVVVTSHVSFELAPPTLQTWLGRLDALDDRDAFLVAEIEGEPLAGFAYSGAFRPKPAYAGSRETTIHLAPVARGRGVGLVLYAALLERLAAAGNRLAVAVVAEPNAASTRLHERLGFERAGTVPDVGEKFGRLWSTTYWYRRLSAGSPEPPSVAAPLHDGPA
jgi:L-amino acid N-acyltransferase YncA